MEKSNIVWLRYGLQPPTGLETSQCIRVRKGCRIKCSFDTTACQSPFQRLERTYSLQNFARDSPFVSCYSKKCQAERWPGTRGEHPHCSPSPNTEASPLPKQVMLFPVLIFQRLMLLVTFCASSLGYPSSQCHSEKSSKSLDSPCAAPSPCQQPKQPPPFLNMLLSLIFQQIH